MQVAGKCPPEKGELESVNERGFENTELYLERKHLDRYEETLQNCREANVNIQSIHTPHVAPEEEEYFRKSDQLAEELDATLVVHSMYLHHINIPKIESIGFKSDHGYENNPGISPRHLEEMIMKQDRNMVLDTAHLYMTSSRRFEANLKYLLSNYSDQISLIHVCDSTMREDGLGLGEGEMKIESMIEIISENYSGKVTLEVMPEHQGDALQKWNSNL